MSLIEHNITFYLYYKPEAENVTLLVYIYIYINIYCISCDCIMNSSLSYAIYIKKC